MNPQKNTARKQAVISKRKSEETPEDSTRERIKNSPKENRNKNKSKYTPATRVFFPPRSKSERASFGHADVEKQSTSYKPDREAKKAPRSEEAEAAWKIAMRIAGAKGYSCK